MADTIIALMQRNASLIEIATDQMHDLMTAVRTMEGKGRLTVTFDIACLVEQEGALIVEARSRISKMPEMPSHKIVVVHDPDNETLSSVEQRDELKEVRKQNQKDMEFALHLARIGRGGSDRNGGTDDAA